MLKSFILVFFLFFSFITYGQEIGTNARSPKPAPMSKLEKEAVKKKQKKQKKIEKADEKARKDHLKIQTKDVRKRMKKSRKEGNRVNANKQEFFMKRWFRKNK